MNSVLRPARRMLVLVLAITATVLASAPAVSAPFLLPGRPEPVQAQSGPALGIFGFSAPDGSGVSVARVVEGSGADEAGLERGDLITAIDRDEVTSMSDLTEIIDEHEAGDEIIVTFERDGESQRVEAVLGEGRSSGGFFEDPGELPGDLPDIFGDRPDGESDSDRDESSSPRDGYAPVVWLFGILICGLLIALIVYLVMRDRRSGGAGGGGVSAEDPLDVARLRYARGEITREEFQNMAQDLGGNGLNPPPAAPGEPAEPGDSGPGSDEGGADSSKGSE